MKNRFCAISVRIVANILKQLLLASILVGLTINNLSHVEVSQLRIEKMCPLQHILSDKKELYCSNFF